MIYGIDKVEELFKSEFYYGNFYFINGTKFTDLYVIFFMLIFITGRQ